MATVYPRSPRSAFLNWVIAHSDAWSQDPEAIGLTPQRAAQYAALLESTRAARLAQGQAMDAAAAATLNLNTQTAALERMTAAMVASIRAHASAEVDPIPVLAKARLEPVRPDRGPAELLPAKPGMVSARLLTTGALELSWKCTQPRGTDGAVYTLHRQLPGQCDFVQLAATGRKRFTDQTIPAGTARVSYYVQARRGDAVGPAGNITTVLLGNAERAATLPTRAAA